MNPTEIVNRLHHCVGRQDYDLVVLSVAKMHPLKAAFIMVMLFDRLENIQKVCLHNSLDESLKNHFVVEPNNYSVRQFGNHSGAQAWVDKHKGARLVQGEK